LVSSDPHIWPLPRQFLESLQKQSLLKLLDMVGANLWVIYPYTRAIHDEVKRLLRRLAPSTVTQDSE
jgi:hypothetical protein